MHCGDIAKDKRNETTQPVTSDDGDKPSHDDTTSDEGNKPSHDETTSDEGNEPSHDDTTSDDGNEPSHDENSSSLAGNIKKTQHPMMAINHHTTKHSRSQQ